MEVVADDWSQIVCPTTTPTNARSYDVIPVRTGVHLDLGRSRNTRTVRTLPSTVNVGCDGLMGTGMATYTVVARRASSASRIRIATRQAMARVATRQAKVRPEVRRPQAWAARPSPTTGSEIAT